MQSFIDEFEEKVKFNSHFRTSIFLFGIQG